VNWKTKATKISSKVAFTGFVDFGSLQLVSKSRKSCNEKLW